ncbi:hypothetical protein [uncultured Polaribacter sp.]|uniref:hypothetical protein n=1 Tax=uncultured Polaribacter sp. TaxID=174711 RepID=UPI0030DBED9B|tara:strand:+ start:39 stop:281 length:243 start_codon:yes stop_codon:yes gene_type:complete
MKKVILSLVFVLATGSMMNATSNSVFEDEIILKSYCIDQMHNAYDFMIGFTGNAQMASDIADAIFEDCESDVDAIPGYYN